MPSIQPIYNYKRHVTAPLDDMILDSVENAFAQPCAAASEEAVSTSYDDDVSLETAAVSHSSDDDVQSSQPVPLFTTAG